MLQTKLVPTTHFMMEHAFELSQEIGTGYYTLHEGVEKKHESKKANARHTFKGFLECNSKNRYVVLMDDLLINALTQIYDEEHESEIMPNTTCQFRLILYFLERDKILYFVWEVSFTSHTQIKY